MLARQLEGETYTGSEQYQAWNSRLAQPNILLDEGPFRLGRKVRIPLKNRYFIWRHGESEANISNVIVSKPENGIDNFGLTEAGIRQVRRQATITHLLSRGIFGPDGLIYSSPFLRCIQTAEVIAQVTGLAEITVANELRERDFGELEGKHTSWYGVVYDLDKAYPSHNFFGVENTDEVSERVTVLVRDLEDRYERRKIILVTHADVGEILQTAFLGLPPQAHRELPKLGNSELRELRPRYA